MVCWKVTLQIEFPLHIFVGGLECLEAIGAIFPCSTVGPGPMLRKVLRDVDMLRASLEHHMFGQMSHTALTRPFVARADQIGNVGHYRGFRGILDGCDLRDAFGRGCLSEANRCEKE